MFESVWMNYSGDYAKKPRVYKIFLLDKNITKNFEIKSMEYKKGMELKLDFSYISFSTLFPNNEELYINNKSNIFTKIIFNLPSNQEYPLGTFYLDFSTYKIVFQIRKISNFQDTVLTYLENSKINISGSGFPMLPVSAYSDNRGKYPCYQVTIEFPYFVSDENFSKENIEQFELGDCELSNENPHVKKIKVIALKLLSIFFTDGKFEKKLDIVKYDEVTAFFVGYYDKNTKNLIGKEIFALTSKNAFKKAVFDYYLGNDIKKGIIENSEKIKPDQIFTEEDLFNEIVTAIHEIIHYVENKRLYQPFWNESAPKKEIDIQPTIAAFLGMLLNGKGIHIIKESDEGIGSLDFKFLYTTINQVSVSLCLEFKLAHNKAILHGITKQLPAYLKANRTKYGIFMVMWFKDTEKKFFTEPSEFEKLEFLEILDKKADEIEKIEGYFIKPVLIDASKKPSASCLT